MKRKNTSLGSFTVGIIGAGAVGGVILQQIASSDDISKVIIGDIDKKKAEALINISKNKIKIKAVKVDATNSSSIMTSFPGVNVLVNASLPDYNIEVMQAALTLNSHYIDMCSGGPVEATDTPDISEQMKFDISFKKKNLSAILCLGADPGLTHIMTRHLSDKLKSVDTILIRDGDNSTVEGYDFCALFSPDVLLEELMLPPLMFEKGEFIRVEPLSYDISEEYAFPQPVGKLRIWSVDHEEVETLPNSIGKGVQTCNFKYALPDNLVNGFKLLSNIGVLSTNPVKMADGHSVIPRSVVAACMPNPSDLASRVHGHSCVGVEISGVTHSGVKSKNYIYTISSHDETYKKYGVSATSYQTGVPVALVIEQLAIGAINEVGCFFPDRLGNPEWYFQELEKRGMPVRIKELPVD